MGPRFLSLLLALSVSTVSASAVTPVFHNPRPLRTAYGNAYPDRLLLGDFGGDAATDVLTVAGEHSIEVRIATPDGLTGNPVVTPITDIVVSAAVGDLDGDGKLDLAVCTYGSPSVVLYRGNGDGTFARWLVFSVPIFGPVAVGDFNRDGHKDFAVGTSSGYQSSYQLTAYLSNGAGGFGAPIATPITTAAGEIDVLDANDDGKDDLLFQDTWSGHLAMAKGDGTFVQIAGPGIDMDGETAIYDFNRDGKIDVAVAADDGIGIYLGQNNGTFVKYGLYAGMYVFALANADVDGDGKMDLVGGQYGGAFGVWRGNGDGTFAPPVLWHTGHIWDLATGDFDRDGNLDVIFLGGIASNGMRFIAGKSGGTFDAYRTYLTAGPVPYAYPGPSTRNVTAADMNNDGAPDLVASVKRDAPFGDIDLMVMLNANDHTGAMQMPLYYPSDADWLSDPDLGVGDVNADGKLDVVTFNAKTAPKGCRVYFGNGDGTLQAPISGGEAVAEWETPHLADFNDDGALDLLVHSTLYFGSNTGTFSSPHPISVRADAIGDLNEDGLPDIVGGNYNTAVAINRGNGAFDVTVFPDGESSGMAPLLDLDGDGHLDMLIIQYSNTLVRLGHGDGTFGDPITMFVDSRILPYTTSTKIGTGDFDGDGKLDIARGSRVYLGNGDGRFRAIAHAEVHGDGGSGFDIFDVADFDGNGTMDVAYVVPDPMAQISILRTRIGPEPELTTNVTLHGEPAAPQHAAWATYTATVAEGAMPLTGSFVIERNGVPFGLGFGTAGTFIAQTALSLGSNTITAIYDGDEHYGPATVSIEHTAVRATTALSVHNYYYEGSRPCGTAIALSVFFDAPRAAGIAPPSGDLEFRENGVLLPFTPWASQPGVYEYRGLAPGTHTITVSYAGDANYGPSSTTYKQVITVSTVSTITASTNVFAGGTGNFASARFYSDGTYTWSITNGTIEAGQGTNAIRYTAGPSGDVGISVTIGRQTAVCGASASATVPTVARAAGATMFYTVTPCRVADTRSTTALGPSETRELSVAGQCGVPLGAKGVVVNATAVAPPATGWLSLYPADAAWPGTSTMNYRAGRTRANGALIPLSAGGALRVKNSGATVHFILDVLGYFQ